jgi:hypothetical protein
VGVAGAMDGNHRGLFEAQLCMSTEPLYAYFFSSTAICSSYTKTLARVLPPSVLVALPLSCQLTCAPC